MIAPDEIYARQGIAAWGLVARKPAILNDFGKQPDTRKNI
jgi:hypothetical protein